MCCSPPEDIGITVQYAGPVERLTDCAEEQVEVPAASTVPELVSILAARHGARFGQEVYDASTARLRPGIVALVNGSPSTPQTWLRDGDRVSFLAAMSVS